MCQLRDLKFIFAVKGQLIEDIVDDDKLVMSKLMKA